ncbi:MAG: DUF4190 domain-containing protein [Oscillospiraceae bacterium]|jgi:hypothetical protein|nr:DUF4190 domain-containing protein [Oscillospiraceae bacterium]
MSDEYQNGAPFPNGGGDSGGNYNSGNYGGNYGGNGGQNISIAALVCGILGIAGGLIPIVQYFTTVLSILAIVFGVKGRRESPPGKTGLATAGLILGVVAVALSIIGIICVACAAASLMSYL